MRIVVIGLIALGAVAASCSIGGFRGQRHIGRRTIMSPKVVLEKRRPDTVMSECWQTYSITSSAIARSVGGIARSSNLAVCKLITNSNFVGCMTGSSAGFSPLRIRPT